MIARSAEIGVEKSALLEAMARKVVEQARIKAIRRLAKQHGPIASRLDDKAAVALSSPFDKGPSLSLEVI